MTGADSHDAEAGRVDPVGRTGAAPDRTAVGPRAEMAAPPTAARRGAVVLPRWVDYGLLPLLNVALALTLTGAVVWAIGQSPVTAMRLLVQGAFGGTLAWSYTLYYATTYIFTGLAVAVAFHAGHFNIGAEGQATLGGLGVGLALLSLDASLSAPLLLPLAALAGIAAGVAWAIVPAWLQAYRGSHIVITTIMFNFLASTLMVWLLVNVVKGADGLAVESRGFAANAALPSAKALFGAVGIHWPDTPLNLAFVIALVACIAVWVLLWHTRLGHALRTVGLSPDAARYAGHDPKRITVVSLCISGGLAGLVGLNEIAGVHHKLLLDFVGGAGFTGIAVALMGRSHPAGIVLAALLFGALAQGGSELVFEIPAFTRDMSVAVQGFVVLFCGALALMLRPPVAWAYGWLSGGRRHRQRAAAVVAARDVPAPGESAAVTPNGGPA